MAIRWDFKTDRIGTLEIEQAHDGEKHTFKMPIYSGNCLMIVLYETKKEYNLYNFLMDKAHAKNMLGLSKECKKNGNLLDNGEWKKITLVNSKPGMELARVLMSAEWNNPITFEIVPVGTDLKPNYHK